MKEEAKREIMKILFLGEPESPNTQSWVEGLREEGCEVVLASVRTDGTGDALAIGNPNLPPRIRVLTGVSHLKKIISEVKPDIVLAYRVTSYGYLAAKSGFHPLVIAAQNEQIVYLPKPSKLRSAFLGRCAKFAISKADLMHAWADNIADGLVKFGADRSKIITMHRGIDMSIFGEGKSLKFDKNAPVFISTRSLAPEYRIENVIEAFSLLLKQIPDATLKIIGSGSEEKQLKQLSCDLEIGTAVRFSGRVDHQRVVEELKESDVYISIIETEGMSSSLIESTACGLLPIVTDMPASRKLIKDGQNGFLINETGPEQLSEVMVSSVMEYEKMQSALSENAEKVKKEFDRKRNQKIFAKKYNELISK